MNGDWKVKPLVEIQAKNVCSLDGCDNETTMYRGPGSDYCYKHQTALKVNGGLGRRDRPHTLNKTHVCEECGYDPRKDPKFYRIESDDVREEAMGRYMHCDHKTRRADDCGDEPENMQTLCPMCHLHKTICEERGIPWPSTPD